MRLFFFFFSSRRRHTRLVSDWSSDVCSSDLVTLTHPVAQGDLLVGWFSQYNAPGEIQVSDNVNGTWTRVAAGALTFDDDKIGRASCRERGWISGVVVALNGREMSGAGRGLWG